MTRGATTRTPGPTVTGAEVVSDGAWGTDGLFVAIELSTVKRCLDTSIVAPIFAVIIFYKTKIL